MINTPFAVVQDKTVTYYLSGGKIRYSATDPMGPWLPSQPPEDVAKVVPRDTSSAPAPKLPPKIVVATEPTELVVSDGAPKWKPLGDGELLHGENSESAWFLDVPTQESYLLLSGRWFRSKATAAAGPWVVADSIPKDQIDSIPPSAPVYNVTDDEIISSTPEMVYLGYYPGYMWSYPVYGVPVYGTGWYYPPPLVPVYYPRPVTYGMHVSYTPWTGWDVGFTWSNGLMTVGIGFHPYPPYHGGFYPPYGYRPPYYRPYPPAGYRPPGGDNYPGAGPSQQPNNVYSAPNGDVYRKTPSGWESPGGSGRPSTSQQPAPSSLNRDAQARDRGASRAAQTSRPSSRGGGAGAADRGGRPQK